MIAPSSEVGFCIYCAFHFVKLTEALTDNNSSFFQYSGHSDLPDGSMAGNSTMSH
jgi:hypothetical protein